LEQRAVFPPGEGGEQAISILTKLYWSSFIARQAYLETRIPWWPAERIEQLQRRRLRSIVTFAWRHVPHYREAMRRLGLRPEDFRTADDLARLPLISKQDVTSAPERFAPDDGHPRAALRIQSSGTTGKPAYVDYDAHALILSLAAGQRRRAVLAHYLGQSFGYRELSIMRLGSVSTQMRRFYEEHTWAPRRVDLERLMLDPGEPFPKLVERINEFRPDVIVGYGSHLGAFMRWLYFERIDFHRPKAVTYGADAMPAADRQIIEEGLGIPVFSFYQSVEALRIAFQCEKRRGLHIFTDHVALRIADAEGRTLPPGEPGEVVVSNLTNRATVLLNYRQGDLAALSRESCPCGRNLPVLEGLQGRRDDLVLRPDGTSVHPLALIARLQRIPGVLQVQLVQEELCRFLVRVVCAPGAAWQEISGNIEDAMRSVLGKGITVASEMCEMIRPGPSGKVRAVICRLKQPGSYCASD